YAVSRIMGKPGLAVMGVTAASAIFTGIIAGCRASTRILSTMAEDGIISKRFSSTTFSVVFITVISIIFSFLGRNTLEWFVDLTTFGAIIGFGYTSGSACVIAKKNGDKAATALGRVGTVITIAFAVVQMIPMVTPFETMSPESFLMLAVWCLVGFVFYWKTMKRSSLSDYQGMSASSTVLFALLFYSALTWHMLTTSAEVEDGPAKWRITATGFITVAVVFVGFTVMLYVQTLLR
ncbi:MAG: hypothetical protein IJT56_04935, partial [Clostridia bacterium]|nr:hypothetical protein [Clostridia bacterium]